MNHLTEQDAGLLEQAASMLEGQANDERNRGNCSSAEGAACSAHAIRRLAPALLRAGRGCLTQIEEPAQSADDVREAFARRYNSDPADPACADDLAVYSAGWHDARASEQPAGRGAGEAPDAVTPHITEPYTLAEIKAKIASHDYNAEHLLQHAMLLLEPAGVAGPALDVSAIAAAVCQRVVELPDRDSPADWPEAMLVTGQELIDVVTCELEQAQAAPALEAPAAPAGWKLVPAKPTDAMLGAAQKAWLADPLRRSSTLYAAALAAAPQAPAAPSAVLAEIVGCIDAANAEGLDDALVNNTDARLTDLVQRRLLPAFYAAIAAQAHAAAKGA